MAEEILLDAQQLSRYYHGRRVLHDVDIQLRRGEVLGFLGPNGAGKSTTMNILSGVLAPHAGTVNICGHHLQREPLAAKRHIGYLPEVPPLHDDATVDEYLYYCGRLRSLSHRETIDARDHVKHDCDLDEVGDRLLGNLSKGFRQRVGIAQALLHQPSVVILDEPTSGLDPNQIRSVRDTIRKLAPNHAVILSTHVLSEAQTLCQRAVIIHHGRVRFDQRIESHRTRMRLVLTDSVSVDMLRDLDQVTEVEEIGKFAYRLNVEDYATVASAVALLATEKKLFLLEMSRDSSPLEETFVELTCNDIEAAP